ASDGHGAGRHRRTRPADRPGRGCIRMKGRIAVGIMSLLLLLYLVVVVQLAFRLLAVDLVVSQVIGVALLVLPLLGAWALVAELLFGIRCDRLIAVLQS